MTRADLQQKAWDWNVDTTHQRQAGYASWMAFSARWRARQGLPLLHPMQVQYLTPGDFCNGRGQPLSPSEQRRLFREYVAAAIAAGVAARLPAGGPRVAGMASGELGSVRAVGFVRRREGW